MTINTRINANAARRGHPLITAAMLRKIPPWYAQDGKRDEAVAHLCFFGANGWHWYVTEAEAYDQAGQIVPLGQIQYIETLQNVRFFGLVVGDETELGSFDLLGLELAEVQTTMQFKDDGTQKVFYRPAIERDLYFTPKTLCEIKAALNDT